jgi:hypothetical protein
LGELVGEAAMQLRNYAAMQPRKKGVFQMFQQISLFLRRSKICMEHLSNIFFSCLSIVPKQEYPNNNKIIYIYIYVLSVVLVLAKSVWEIFFFNFQEKLRRGDWDQALTFSYLVGLLLFGFYAFWSLELIAFLPTF